MIKEQRRNSISHVLIVGFGSIGRRHAGLARKLLPHAEIRVLRRDTLYKLEDTISEQLIRLDDAAAFSPDIAIIANPAPFHASTALRLAEIGVDLLVEKPLATSTMDARRIVEACASNDVLLMVGYNLRFSDSLNAFRDYIATGGIGKVLSVRAEVGQYLPSWRGATDYRESVSAKQELGGGVLFELSHEIDYLQWIFGQAKWVQSNVHTLSDLEVDVEDTAHLVVGLDRGDEELVVANLNMDFFRHDKTRQCVAIGEKGTIRWDGVTNIVDVYEANAPGWRTLRQQSCNRDTYHDEWLHFLDCVLERSIPVVPGSDGVRTLEVIDAARRSSLNRGRIEKCREGYL